MDITDDVGGHVEMFEPLPAPTVAEAIGHFSRILDAAMKLPFERTPRNASTVPAKGLKSDDSLPEGRNHR